MTLNFFKNNEKALRILLVTNAMVLVAPAMFAPIYAIYVERIGGNLLDASFTVGVFALAAGLTTLATNKHYNKIKDNELVVVSGYFIMGLGFLLYIFVDSILFLFFVQALIGFAEALYSPVFETIYSKHSSHKKVCREWATWGAMRYFMVGIGAVFSGVIVTTLGFMALFLLMSGLCFLSGLYIYFLPRGVL